MIGHGSGGERGILGVPGPAGRGKAGGGGVGDLGRRGGRGRLGHYTAGGAVSSAGGWRAVLEKMCGAILTFLICRV